MKKLILVLSVVAMAAFLLVGCLPKTNTAPVITYSASQTATVGTEFTSTVTATDAEGDTLTFSVSDGPTGMVIDSATGVISGWTPAAAGTETVLVTVTDGKDPSTLTVTITVVVPAVGDITIAVATETLPDADGKIFVKGGSREITVTFPAAVGTPVVKVGTEDVGGMFSVDGKVWKGTHKFVGDDAVTITVSGECEPLCTETKSVVVDSLGPVVELEAKAAKCDCEGSYALTITSEQLACVGCVADPGCCKDAGSGVVSWNVKIYDADPWKVPVDPCPDPCSEECPPCCSDDPCIDPIKELDGTTCPIVVTTECIEPELVWDDVADKFVTKTYFEKVYFVIATLIDNVGNKTTYNGVVRPWDYKPDNYVYNFPEIIHPHPDDAQICYCEAEDWDDADSVLGDCSGTPATECWEAEPVALICPDVTPLSTDTVVVGVKTTITLDFNRDVDEAVDGQIMAYISDGAKSTPPNIPDNALPLFLVQSTTDLKVFTGEVTFDTAGSKVLYVLWDCETCAPCMYEINVSAIEDCPEIAWFGDSGTVIDGVTWLKGGDTYTFTLTYDHVITDDEQKLYQVRIRDYTSIIPILPSGGLIFDDFRILADMDASAGDTVFTGTFTPPSIDDKGEYCTVAYVEVDILEDCCEPCMYKFGVDADLPGAEIEITAVDCCGFAFLEFDSVPLTCDATCCGDTCTSVVGWTIDIYDTEPIWDCCVLQATPAPVCSHEGTECPIDVNKPAACADCCLDTDDYWIITTLTDAVGNVNAYYGEVTLTGSVGVWHLDGEEFNGWECDPASDGDATSPFNDPSKTPDMENGDKDCPTSNTEQYGDSCSDSWCW